MGPYSHTYKELLDSLDWLAVQQKESADTAALDKFRFLPHTQAPEVVSEVIKDMVNTAKDRYQREISFRFFDITAGIPAAEYGVFDIEINSESLKNSKNIFILPKRIHTAVNWLNKTTNRWQTLYDSSQSQASMYCPAHNEIYSETAFAVSATSDDYMKFRAIVYPRDIIYAISLAASDISAAAFVYTNALRLTLNTATRLEPGDYVTLAAWVPAGLNGSLRVGWVSDDRKTIYLNSGTTSGTITKGTLSYSPNDQTIEVDDPFYDYLKLEIKRRAYERKQKALSPYEYSRLKEKERLWINSSGKAHQRASLRLRGAGFGK